MRGRRSRPGFSWSTSPRCTPCDVEPYEYLARNDNTRPVSHGAMTPSSFPNPFAPIALGALCLLGWTAARAAPPAPPAAPTSRGVPALLVARCGGCHGARAPKAGLDLTSAAGIARGGDRGPALVPGNPDDSPLYGVLRDGRMPPKGAGRISRAETEAVRRWIAEGAGAVAAAAPPVTQHDVLPMLRLRCTVCHGLRRQEGGLDLRSLASMLKGGRSGPAMVRGKPGESLVVKRVHAGEMPPPGRLVEVSVKPMEPGELALLSRWIAAGAPELAVRPDAPGTGPAPLVSERDRSFWAFRPPRRMTPPRVAGREAEAGHSIDAFLLRDLKKQGLSFAPEADRAALIRRATFDLTGLPPAPAEAAAFVADRDPRAYEKLIDRLLASPRYGERSARRWLDLAGYSDSEGIQDADPLRPFNWRYRDYVIRAFNADKPYDRFLLEQIAGDELADYERGPVTTEIADNLIATGFLRQTTDATFAGITGFVPDRLDVVADEVAVLGSAVMGLTLKCARCHDHKFDPIPQRDYFRLLDVFKGALDEHDWLSPQLGETGGRSLNGRRYLPHVTPEEREKWETLERALDTEAAGVRDALTLRGAELRAKGVMGTDDELKQKDADFRRAAEAAAARLKEIEGRRQPAPVIRALWDRGEPSPTYVLKRGDYLQRGPLVGPGVPTVLLDAKSPFVVRPPWPGARQTGRRLAFARWLARPDHPLTARVLVNRVWKEHFGRGIVETVDNFGRAGARPSHPELLDWLASSFTSSGWSLKSLHRRIMLSRAYRQSSAPSAAARARDPENRSLSRMPLRRLDAEEVGDTIALAAGKLDETPFGPPDELEVRADGLVRVKGTSKGWRRSIYALQRRKNPISLLEAFDLPQMSPNCVSRSVSTVATQALHLLNDARVRELAGSFAERVRADAGEDAAAQVERACLLALGRSPAWEERRAAVETLARLQERWSTEPGVDPAGARSRALADYCHALLNSAAFLYID